MAKEWNERSMSRRDGRLKKFGGCLEETDHWKALRSSVAWLISFCKSSSRP